MPDEQNGASEDAGSLIIELRLRAEMLERQLSELKQQAESRLVRAELKAEAIRAGIADPEGLKLVDTSQVKLNESGEVENAPAVVDHLKQTRPWLFPGSGRTSSTAAPVPPARPPRAKLATEMSEEEWRVARAALLKR